MKCKCPADSKDIYENRFLDPEIKRCGARATDLIKDLSLKIHNFPICRNHVAFFSMHGVHTEEIPKGVKNVPNQEIVEYINELLQKSPNWTTIADLAASKFKSQFGKGQNGYYKAQEIIKGYMALNLSFENGKEILK